MRELSETKIIERVKRAFVDRLFGDDSHHPRIYPIGFGMDDFNLSMPMYQYRVGPGEEYVLVYMALVNRKLAWVIGGIGR